MNNEIKTISPFKNFCVTIGALPTSYLESMSYYEMLCWLCKYLENTINPAINQNAEALKELQNYVSNYFDNLDVQTEINNKLDDMAESGVLAEIINVEMIGTLSNLTTTDKTDVVSAINEVNSNINKLNIVNFNTFNTDNIQVQNATLLSANITVADNSDHSIGKIYGTLSINTSESANLQVAIRFQSNFAPSSDINIYCGALETIYAGAINSTGGAYLKIKTTGVIEINTSPGSSVTRIDFYFPPCLYFIKDFGD